MDNQSENQPHLPNSDAEQAGIEVNGRAGKFKPWIIVSCAVILLMIVSGGAYALFGRSTSYQTVTNNFIVAVQKKDKKTADSLESPAFKTAMQKAAGNNSFYDACQTAGTECVPLFAADFLNKATKSYKNYTSSGLKGQEVVYAFKQTKTGTSAGGVGCSATTEDSLSVAVVPKGRSWLVNDVEPSVNGSSQCPKSTAQTPTIAPTAPAATTPNTSAPKASTTQPKSTPAAPTPTPTPPVPAAPQGNVTISADGCNVNAVAYVSGMSVEVGSTQNGHGQDSTYPLTANSGLTEPTGGQYGWMAYGWLKDSSGNTVATAQTTVTSNSCLPLNL